MASQHPFPTEAAVEVHNLSKSYGAKRALSDVTLTVGRGEMVALIGASGSGKSTLLRHISGLARGDTSGGRVLVLGRPVQSRGVLARDVRATRTSVGFVFQQFNLVERLPVLTNVLVGSLGRIPAWRGALGLFPAAERDLALAALQRVGVAECATRRSSTLSGGQQQRAAIARVLLQGAEVVIADEPIASLDPEASRRVMEILARINREDGRSVVVSLHQVDFALRYCPRIVGLRDGRIIFDGAARAVTPEVLADIYGSELSDAGFHGVMPHPGVRAEARPASLAPAAA